MALKRPRSNPQELNLCCYHRRILLTFSKGKTAIQTNIFCQLSQHHLVDQLRAQAREVFLRRRNFLASKEQNSGQGRAPSLPKTPTAHSKEAEYLGHDTALYSADFPWPTCESKPRRKQCFVGKAILHLQQVYVSFPLIRGKASQNRDHAC